MTELSKDADKAICCIYKSYLEKRKSGKPKKDAKFFDKNFYLGINPLSTWDSNDVSDALSELSRAGFLKLSISGSFQLKDDSIVYMESRFKNGLIEITDFVSKFIP